MTMRLTSALAAAVAIGALTTLAHAESIYRFISLPDVTTCNVGSLVTVQVYLEEQVTSGTSVLVSEHGLATAGVAVQADPPTTTVATINAIRGNDTFLNDMFAWVTTSPDPTGLPANAGYISEGLDTDTATQGIQAIETSLGSGVWRVKLGEFDVAALSGGTVNFALTTTLSDSHDLSTLDNPVTFDASVDSGQYSLTVVPAIPEPASLIFLALGGALAIARRHRPSKSFGTGRRRGDRGRG